MGPCTPLLQSEHRHAGRRSPHIVATANSAKLPDAIPAPCWTEGVLVRNEPDYLVVATSQYSGPDIGDYTVVVKGCIKRITSTNQKVSG